MSPITRVAGLALGLAGAAALAPIVVTQEAVAQGVGREPLYTVLNPIGIAPPIERKAMAPRPESVDGKTIFLVDVTFNGGDLFLLEMQKWMTEHMPEVTTEFRIKKGYYAADDPALWEEIQAVDGLMIMAIGH